MSKASKLLFSHRLCAGGRWYFFDIKEAVDGTKYLSVSETRQFGGIWQRRRLLVFEEYLQAFLDGLSAATKSLKTQSPHKKTYSVAEIRSRHARAYAPWSVLEDRQLLSMHQQGASVAVLAAELQRQPSAIRSRLNHLTGYRRLVPGDGLSGSQPTHRSGWRQLRPRAGRTWQLSEDNTLLADFDAGVPVEEIASRLGRGVFSVR